MINPFYTAEYQVSYEVHTLQTCISRLWEMRLNPLTADYLLIEEGALRAVLGTLTALNEDIREANDKRDSVAQTFIHAAE